MKSNQTKLTNLTDGNRLSKHLTLNYIAQTKDKDLLSLVQGTQPVEESQAVLQKAIEKHFPNTNHQPPKSK